MKASVLQTFYYLKKQEGTGKIRLSTVKICTSFCSSYRYDIKCNMWKYIRTEEPPPPLHLTLFRFHKASVGSVCLPKNWERGKTRDLHEEGNISACVLDNWSHTLSLECTSNVIMFPNHYLRCKIKGDVLCNREVELGQIGTVFQGIMCNTSK